MLEHANYAGLVRTLPIIEEVLDAHVSEVGRDLVAYRNHVYRVVNLCLAIVGDRRVDSEKIAVAAVFHDLGIWTNHTFDYIPPSVAIAHTYLATRGMSNWIPEIEAMIEDHHKVTSSQSDPQLLVESFRRADWIDVTRGLRSFGIPRSFISVVLATWPNAGFHRRLVQLTLDRFRRHPFTPLPMFKW
jgi:hypothetical protein